MSEGRSELEKAIDVWEQRHAAAVRATREAEVVMPFLRAAIEELDSFHEVDPTAASSPAAAATETSFKLPASPAINPSASVDGTRLVEPESPSPQATEGTTAFPAGFSGRAISSLMNENKDEEKAS